MNLATQLLAVFLSSLPMLALPVIAQARRGKRHAPRPAFRAISYDECYRRRRPGFYRLRGWMFVRAWR